MDDQQQKDNSLCLDEWTHDELKERYREKCADYEAEIKRLQITLTEAGIPIPQNP